MNITKYKSAIGAAVLGLVLACAGFGQTADEARVLPLVPLEREIRGGEVHSYRVSLKAGEFLRVTVEQNGVDVVVRLVGADGKLLTERDRPNGRGGEESLAAEAAAAGAYRVEVAALETGAAVGKYQIRHESPRLVTAIDKKRIAAENIFQEAQKLRETQTAESWRKALAKYEEVLSAWQSLKDDYAEALTLSTMALTESALGDSEQAAKRFIIALRKAEAVKSESLIDDIRAGLHKLAENYLDNGTKLHAEGTIESLKGAADKLKTADELFRESGDKASEATANLGLGRIAEDMDDEAVLKYYEKALILFRQVDFKFGEAATLNNIGSFYAKIGEYQRALKFCNEGLSLVRTLGEKSAEATSLNTIGLIYSELGDLQQALKFQKEALLLNRAFNNKDGEASSLNNIGGNYHKLNDYQQALKFYNEALPISRNLGDKRAEATTLNNIGAVYTDLGDKQQALKYLNETLPLRRAVGDKSGEAVTLNNLMDAWNRLGNRRLATFYGKQSINKYQELRQAIQGLEKEAQKTYLKTVEYYYRGLADILVADGRLFEAQQVLAMLKEDEYFSYVRRDADEIKKLSARADLRSDEQAALVRYNQLAGKVTEFGTQFSKLEDLKNQQGIDFKQKAEYDDLKAKLNAANAAFRIFLEKELAAEFSKKETVKEIKEDRTLLMKLQNWGKGTVALYTVAGDDRYRVILTTPKTQVDGKTEIKIADLNRKIFEFRAALQNPQVDPRPLGKGLYDILIKPIEKDLDQAEAKTLLWSLDGTLRYIPFAALSPDGVHYLAEKYQNVVITSTTRQSLLAETDPHWRLLGAGVTKASKLTEPNGVQEITFSALPEVKNELLKIVSNEAAKTKETGLLSGIRLLDEGFDLSSLENGMTQRTGGKPKYNVIHLATHFRLGGDTAKSFLLMGNNQALTLEKVSDDTALNFGDVELVTLSACNTGFGTTLENKAGKKEQERRQLEANNGAEVDSLATFIELRGAKAVLASLWSVADESTQMLMSEFYRLRKENPNLTKAEAMQQAQKSMIEGRLKSSGKQTGCRSEIVNLDGNSQTAFKCDTNAPFAHPYFWSPFVLIGNWR